MNTRKAIVILIITAMAVEVLSRVILSQIHNRKYDSDLIVEKLYAPTDGLRANAGGTVWGKPFHTDEIGGRKQTTNKPGKKKILIMGDEVTQGVGVADDETFANLVNERSKYDVRNISLIRLCTPDYLRLLEDFSFAEDEESSSQIESVYLFVSLDDIYCKVKPGEFPPREGHAKINRIDDILQRQCGSYELASLLIHHNSRENFDYDKKLYEDDNKVNSMVSDIAKMDSLCKEKSITFSVYLLPYRAQLSVSSDDLPQRRLAHFLSQKSISFYDLLPPLKKAAANDPAALYLFADEIHLSPSGHIAVAKVVSP